MQKSKLLSFTLIAFFALAPAVVLRLGDTPFGVIDLGFGLVFCVVGCFYLKEYFSLKIALLCYLIFLSISTLGSSFDESKMYLVVRLVFILSPLLLLGAKIRGADLIYKSIYMGLLSSVLIGLYVFYFQIDVGGAQQKVWTGSGVYNRAGGLLGNSAGYGLVCAIFFVYGVLNSQNILNGKRGHYVVLSVTFIVGIISIAAASSRGAMLFILVSLAFYFAFYFRTQPILIFKWIFGGGVLLYVVSVVVGLIMDSDYIDAAIVRFFGGGGNSYSSGRLENWMTLIESWNWEVFFLGVGYKASPDYLGFFVDNTLIVTLVEGGVFAVLSLVCVLVMLFMILFGRARSGDKLALSVLSIYVGFVAHSLTLDILTIWIATPVVLGLVSFSMANAGRSLGGVHG